MPRSVGAIAELESVRKENGGVLHPTKVLEYARDEGTDLHRYFEWDDAAAAEKHRLETARRLIILAKVTVVGREEKPVRVRAYTSLMSDRDGKTGYRATVEVLEDEDLRQEMLRTAMIELEALRRKFANLKELAPVMKAIDRVLASQPQREVRASA